MNPPGSLGIVVVVVLVSMAFSVEDFSCELGLAVHCTSVKGRIFELAEDSASRSATKLDSGYFNLNGDSSKCSMKDIWILYGNISAHGTNKALLPSRW